MMVDVLAKLHRLDPDAVGLGDLGKPQGFLNRAVEGWIKRATLATSDWGRARTDALIVELSRWMRANVVPDQHIVLLHNDYKLDNILLSPETLAPRSEERRAGKECVSPCRSRCWRCLKKNNPCTI